MTALDEAWQQLVAALENAGVHHRGPKYLDKSEAWDIWLAMYEIATEYAYDESQPEPTADE